MTSIWIRAEQRLNEQRVGITPDGVDSLVSAGFNVIIERDQTRAIPIQQFKNVKIVDAGTDILKKFISSVTGKMTSLSLPPDEQNHNN